MAPSYHCFLPLNKYVNTSYKLLATKRTIIRFNFGVFIVLRTFMAVMWILYTHWSSFWVCCFLVLFIFYLKKFTTLNKCAIFAIANYPSFGFAVVKEKHRNLCFLELCFVIIVYESRLLSFYWFSIGIYVSLFIISIVQ